jgi:hypothetical protein
VTYIDQTPSDESALESDRVVCRDSIDRLLLDAAARAVHRNDAHADRGQWRVLAWFARRRGNVDDEALRRCPMLPLPVNRAAAVLRTRSRHRATPSPMSTVQILGRLRRYGRAAGVLVL